MALILLAIPAGAGAEKKSMSQQAAQFENRICGVNPNRTLFRNMKYDEVVLYYTNLTPKEQTALAEFPTAFKTKALRAKEVKSFLTTNYVLLKTVEEIAAMITDRFTAKKLNWVGIEKALDELPPQFELEQATAAIAAEALLVKDKTSPKDIKSYLMLHMGPLFYVRWKNKEFRKATKVIALDDVTIRMKARAYTDAKDEKATALLQVVPGSGIRTSDMEKIIDISQVSLFSGVKERTPELQALIAKIKKPEVKKLVESYRVWIEQGVDSLGERDENIAKTILAQKGMGLVMLSPNSSAGVSERLMNACPNQLKSLSKSPPNKNGK